jgi:hypothetical protein
MRRARARERASALRSRDDGTGTFSSSACFLEDRANSWQEQAYCRRRLRLGAMRSVPATSSRFFSSNTEERVSKCSWWSGSTTHDEEGRVFLCPLSDAFNICFPTPDLLLGGAQWILYFMRRAMNLCVTVQQSVTTEPIWPKGPSRWGAVHLRA